MPDILVNVVGEMRRVPDHHVLVANLLPVDEAVDVGFVGWSNGNHPIVDLVLVVARDPYIAAPEVVGDTVVGSRDQVVSVAGLGVPDLPSPAASGVPAPLGLELEGMPVRRTDNRWRVKLANHVVLCGADVEVEPPVDVVVVDVADARIVYGREPEARADGPVIVESPPADVAIPARLHLAYHDDLLAHAVYRNTEEIAHIGSGFEDGLCWRRTPPDSWSDIRPICLDHAFLPRPVAVRAAGVAVVLDVEYRGVGLVEHEFATIHYVPELDAGSVGPRGCGGPDHEEAPEGGTTLGDGDLVLTGGTLRSGALARTR